MNYKSQTTECNITSILASDIAHDIESNVVSDLYLPDLQNNVVSDLHD